MAENMVMVSSSDENHNQVAIDLCSASPVDRSLSAAAGGSTTPRSPGFSMVVVPVESPEKTTGKPQTDDHDQQQGPLTTWAAAEFIGTFILVFTVLSTVVMDARHGGAETLVGVAASAGLAVVAVVLSVVHISGSHLNPAVSLAMAALGHLPPAHLLPYAAVQTAASLAAAFLAKGVYRPARPAVMATVPAAGVGAGEAFVVESKELVAIAIAAAIMMNALVGGPSTGPSMNPARTIGAAVATGEYRQIMGMDAASASVTVPPMQMQAGDQSNRIAIIISPRAGSSKILPFELVNGAANAGSQRHADPAESTPEAHHHLWHPVDLPKIKPPVPLVKKVGAEFFGTFTLIFTVLSTIIMDEQHKGVESLLGIATSAGLAVTVLVLSLIHISGCHLNPAVSIAMTVFGHLPPAHLLPYIAAQILGSITASFAVKGMYHPVNPGIVTVPKVGTVEAFFLEFVTTFVLLFIITALATDPNAVKELIAVAVGATIMMNALVAGPSTGASMNPARTLGPAIATGRYTQIWKMEGHKSGMEAVAVTIPPLHTGESNHRIDSNVSSQCHADPAELSDETQQQSLWHLGLRKIIPSSVPLLKKVSAEFFGTFILIFTVLSTIIMDEQHKSIETLLGIATSAGLAVTVLVLSLIHISGCHLNPAISIAMAVFGHLPPAHLLPYISSQILGAVAASFAVKGLYHPVNPGIVTVPNVGTVEAFFVEFIITFFLLFIITALATDPNAVKELIAVAVGATVMMNILVAGPSTGASMNPARTIGAAIATGRYTQIWVYLVATPLGAIAGTGAYVTCDSLSMLI
uniref:Uncharacterized protein n=1 Tax=Oryza rufipogon TaxID=4529 RepID=A0A0E0QEE7_ORYRU